MSNDTRLPRRPFIRSETCACEMPAASAIWTCVSPDAWRFEMIDFQSIAPKIPLKRYPVNRFDFYRWRDDYLLLNWLLPPFVVLAAAFAYRWIKRAE